MKVALLRPDHLGEPPTVPPNRRILAEDLELPILYRAMSGGDEFLFRVAEQVVPAGCVDIAEILYRRQVLTDCLNHPTVVRELYGLAVAGAQERPQTSYAGLTFGDPTAILRRSLDRLDLLVADLRRLRALSDTHAARFESEGFSRLFTMIADQLDDDYLARIDADRAELRFPEGISLSAALGAGNAGTGYQLHRPTAAGKRRRAGRGSSAVEFRIPESDDAGYRALNALTGRAVGDVADLLSHSADRIEAFFARLRGELGFYLGCLNLHEQLTASQRPMCWPEPTIGEAGFTCHGLRDAGLCLTTTAEVVGNDVDARGKTLTVITGTNAGGKSTFLRSLGLARVMMHAGMFAVADSFSANVRHGVFTHFAREEDTSLVHGKLDEELARMHDIIATATADSLLLCNESFASTNEREGSEIADTIVRALTDAGVEVVFVTHLYDLAHRRYLRHHATDLFLSPQRDPDGTRTYRLTPAEPEPTSHGRDSYHRIFGVPPC